jgi:hypothetical protein
LNYLKFGAFLLSTMLRGKMPTEIFIKPAAVRGLPHSAATLAVPHRERPQEVLTRGQPGHRHAQASQLAELAASTRGGKIGYGVLAFWIIVAGLLAARIAFLDPSKIDSTSSLFGPTAPSALNDTSSRRN